MGACAQDTAAALRGLKRDLVVCAIMAAGNDYLPSVPGGGLASKPGKPSLWACYLGLRTAPGWRHGCAVNPLPASSSARGDLPVPGISICAVQACCSGLASASTRCCVIKANETMPLCRSLVLDDEVGGGVSLNRQALLALLQEWPQSRRPQLPPRAPDSDDDEAAARFAQAPNAELYLKACPAAPAILR